VIHAQLTHVIPHISNLALFFQDQGSNVGFSLPEMWARMGIPAKAVVIILFIMSIWSLAVIIDRAIYFNAARKQSREFAPKVAGALREGKLDEAVKVADRNKKSHLAEVVTAGLQEFRSYGNGGAITEDQIESSKRALNWPFLGSARIRWGGRPLIGTPQQTVHDSSVIMLGGKGAFGQMIITKLAK
jgi:hypothetical protein